MKTSQEVKMFGVVLVTMLVCLRERVQISVGNLIMGNGPD